MNANITITANFKTAPPTHYHPDDNDNFDTADNNDDFGTHHYPNDYRSADNIDNFRAHYDPDDYY